MKLYTLLVLLIMLQANSNAQTNDQQILAMLKEYKIPALGLAIIENGKASKLRVFGEHVKGKTALNNTIFNVASLTKPITAMVALKMVSLGKLDLNEPIAKYYTDPDIATDSNKNLLTTKIILSHQTGFPNWRYMNKSKKLDFKFKPGSKYSYSGEGFEYLRKVLESKFKKSINEMATELIFKPLQMNSTQYFWNERTDRALFAVGYDKNGKPYPLEKNKQANGADNLQTTIEDYSKFLVNILAKECLTDKVYNEMIEQVVTTKKNKYFGLGFEIYDLGNGEHAYSHGGSDRGCRTIFFILPKTKQGIIILTNSDNGANVYEKMLKLYLGDKGEQIINIEKSN